MMKKRFSKTKLTIKPLFFILFVLLIGFFVIKSINNSNIWEKTESAIQKNSANLECEDFEEDVLWSDDFINSNMGSASYYTWEPKNSCNETKRENCFLQKIIVNSRTIYVSGHDTEIGRESYVQISNLDETECNSPEVGEYHDYLAYEQIKGIEGSENNWYCRYEKNDSEEMIKLNPRCELTNKLNGSSGCFGIKVYASRSLITDVFKIKYSWCWDYG